VRRHILRLAAVFSLLICAATFILFIRSFSVTDEAFLIYRTEGAEHLSLLKGRLFFQHIRPNDGIRGAVERVSHRATPVQSLPPHPWFTRPPTTYGGVDFLNIPAHIPGDIQQARQVVKNPRPIMMIGNDGKPTPESIKAMQKWLKADNLVNTPPTYWAIAFPLWMVAIITLIAPSTLLFYPFVRSHWRRRYGRCTGCGYSLTANISGVCPECGTAIFQASPPA